MILWNMMINIEVLMLETVIALFYDLPPCCEFTGGPKDQQLALTDADLLGLCVCSYATGDYFPVCLNFWEK